MRDEDKILICQAVHETMSPRVAEAVGRLIRRIEVLEKAFLKQEVENTDDAE